MMPRIFSASKSLQVQVGQPWLNLCMACPHLFLPIISCRLTCSRSINMYFVASYEYIPNPKTSIRNDPILKTYIPNNFNPRTYIPNNTNPRTYVPNNSNPRTSVPNNPNPKTCIPNNPDPNPGPDSKYSGQCISFQLSDRGYNRMEGTLNWIAHPCALWSRGLGRQVSDGRTQWFGFACVRVWNRGLGFGFCQFSSHIYAACKGHREPLSHGASLHM